MENYNEINSFNGENVVDELNLLLFNIPDNLTVLEKIRWLYIKVGQIFSYNYKVVDDIQIAKQEINFLKNYVNRFQTCTQISYLFNLMLNNIEGCKSTVIERKANIRGVNAVEHVANLVTLETGEKYILDLTLDLYLIQSGCQTKHFGFDGDIENTCDIISLKECETMDKKLGLIKNNEYLDNEIQRLKEQLNSKDYSNIQDESQISYKINKIIPIIPKFNGYHEGKQFINKLFFELLDFPYKEFNLTYNHDGDMELVTCFKIENNSSCEWYLYDSKLGLINTNINNLTNMLSSGWNTKSQTLLNEINYNVKRL